MLWNAIEIVGVYTWYTYTNLLILFSMGHYKMPNVRYKFYTFRPHPCDLQKFEDYLKFFIPYVKNHKHYAYAVERPDTPDRHIHAIISGTFDTSQKWTTHENGKKTGLDRFKEIIVKGSTTSEHGFDTKLIPDNWDEIYNVLGYIYKETHARKETNWSTKTVTESVEKYYARRRIEAIEPAVKDWIYVTKKNAYAHFDNFIKKYGDKYKVDLHSSNLATALSKERYALVDLSAGQFATIVRQMIVQKQSEEHLHAQYHLNMTYSASNNICSSCEMTYGEIHPSILGKCYEKLTDVLIKQTHPQICGENEQMKGFNL